MLTRADGSTVSSLVGRGAVARFRTPSGSYVVPRSAVPEMRQIDLSLFDVTALASARRHGRIPVVVRFAPGTARSLPGLALARRTTRYDARGTVIRGSYGPRFGGLTRADLRRVVSIRLAGPASRSATPHATLPTTGARAGVPTHTVSVHISTKSGGAAGSAVVTLMNVEDADTYFGQEDSNGSGVARFDDVPEGDYSVIAFTFSKVVMDPEFSVSADDTVELHLADATLKPQVSLAHHRHVDTAFSVARWPEQGFSFPFSFTGPHFFMRVQPAPAAVAHGSLFSGASATFVSTDASKTARGLAVTSDVVRGVPDPFVFVHHRRDFARVVDLFHANGPARMRPTFTSSADGRVDLFLSTERNVPVPGRRVTLFQAGPHDFYQQTLFPQADSASLDDLTQVTSVRRYRQPGTTHVVHWDKGPLGPGLERAGLPGPAALAFSGAARTGNHLFLALPLFEAAGSLLFGYVDSHDGSWTLRQGEHVLARGRHAISRRAIRLPRAGHRYVLTAASHPAEPSWQLSTRVTDVWSFRSASGRSSVPILMPSYVAPQSLSNSVRPGHTSYRLTFLTTARHPSRVRGAEFLFSTNDGRSWRRARLTRLSPTSFAVHYRTPRARGSARYLSLRVVAGDGHGSRVEETAMRAFRLR